MPELNGALPEELVQRLITRLVKLGRLDNDILYTLLDEQITALTLDNCKQVSDKTCIIISKKCPHIRKLSLANCINIRFVESLASCHFLRSINLEGCVKIKDNCISKLAESCKDLAEVNFAGCVNLTDAAMKELSKNCPNITYLSLKKCRQITDSVFEQLTFQLQQLDISDCDKLTDEALCHVAEKSSKLKSLILSNQSSITDTSLEKIASTCNKLRDLELNNCDNITDITVQTITKRCPKLRKLSLSSCKNITASAFIRMEQFRKQDKQFDDTGIYQSLNMQHLDLTRCLNVTNEGLDYIAAIFPNLKELRLTSCEGIGDRGMIAVANRCLKLEVLSLERCKTITDESIMHVAKCCVRIKSLSLRNCKNISDESIIQLVNHCTQMVELDVSYCDITDKSLSQFSVGFSKLEVLRLEELESVTAQGISRLGGCKKLQTLVLTNCKGVSNESLQLISQNCPLIKSIDLSFCNVLSFPTLTQCLSQWPELRELSLRGYLAIEKAGFTHPNLENLNLSWSKNLDDTAVREIAQGCPMLQSLNLAYCSKIDSNCIQSLLQTRPLLSTLNLRGCNKITSHQAKLFSLETRMKILL